MFRYVSLVAYVFCASLGLFQSRTVAAAGSVEMQVEHIVTVSIDEYNQAMEAGTPAGWMKYFTDNVRRSGLLSAQEGREQFSQYYEWEFKNFKAKIVTHKIIVSGRSAAVVFLWDAIHTPSGSPVQLEMVAIYDMATSGKFDSVSFYYDTAKAAKYFGEASATSK